MDLNGINYSPIAAQNQPVACKRKCVDCMQKVQGLYYRDQPVREGKKRFWIDLFYEKTGIELGKGTKKTCYVVKQDSVFFALLKSKIDMSKNNAHVFLEAFYQEREIQVRLSKYAGFVNIIDSFLLKSRKNPEVIKWYTLAERYNGDLGDIKVPIQLRDIESYILQIALRIQEVINENIILPDFKLDNLVYRESDNVATITDFGSAHYINAKPLLITMTMAYQSPERSRRDDGGFPAMIYAFGVCIATLVYGDKISFPSTPLEKKGERMVKDSNRTQFIKDITSWRNKLPPHKFRAIILDMTDLTPSLRPPISVVVATIKSLV